MRSQLISYFYGPGTRLGMTQHQRFKEFILYGLKIIPVQKDEDVIFINELVYIFSQEKRLCLEEQNDLMTGKYFYRLLLCTYYFYKTL